MIVRFRHGGLAVFFRSGSARKIQPAHAGKLRLVLTALNSAIAPQDMNLPGLSLHPLKGDMLEYWSVSISGNWRVVFRFEGVNVTDVDYVDYH